MSMQAAAYYKFQARVAELRAEIDEMKKDGRKLRKLGLNTTALDSVLGSLEGQARELAQVVGAAEPEVLSLIRASRGEET